MPKIHPEAPYYDSYDPSKNYVGILAVPGKVEQAREFTELGSMHADFLGRLGDSLYRNGTIIDGCTILIQDKQVIISSGRIYLDGLIRLVDGTTLDIEGTGSEVIGAKVISSIVTDTEDPTLRDPAQGFENYGQDGAHRIKEVVEFFVNDSASSTIYRLEDGELVTSDKGEQDDVLTSTLARRTYEESGNYKVRGLQLQARNETRDGQILISLTDGKAYIQGFEVTKMTASTIKLNYSQSTRKIISEPKTFSAAISRYPINNYPVMSFEKVVGIVEFTSQITRGNVTGGIDYLPKTPVVKVIEVRQGSTVFTQGVDYQLTTDGIDWSLNGNDPSIGSTYEVVYQYNKPFIVGTDIELIHDEADGRDYLQFIPDGDTPVANSQFNIDYYFYLARKDLICLNKDGEITVFEGKPDVARLAESPLNQDEHQLIIGTCLVQPNSAKVLLSNFNTIRLTQAELYNMLRRVEDIEYNQAITDLDQEAMDGESATDLKGVFTDGFIGLTKCDTTHPDFDCTIDLDNQELTLPTQTSIHRAEINKSTFETKISELGRILMAPYTHKLCLQQPYATGVMLVNPYAVFDPMSIVKLNPAVDNWIDTEKIQIEDQKTVSTTLRRWWYHRGEAWAEAEKQKWMNLGFADGGASLAWASGKATSTNSSTEIVFSEAIMYMRQIPVEVSASNFTPFADNITCYFNDTQIPLVATGTTQAGTMSGTVRADANGRFTAQFTVPTNVPCGSVDVTLKCATCQGSAIYQAQGRKQILQETVLTTTTVVNPTDPLAQSFGFDVDTILTKVGLYFSTKDPSKAVVVQVRNMVNGYPGTTCYTAVTVNSDDIVLSEKGTLATEVVFDQPVYCKANEQYCICILSDSNLYQMFTAELGAKDLQSGQFVTSQPYNAGVLFSSSNAMTWTAHQTMDLKFDLYQAQYIEQGQIIFSDITSEAMSRIVLAAQAVDYQNRGVEWFYQIDDNNTWLPLDTYVDRDLSLVAKSIRLKAVINTSATNSPIVASDCINLIGFMEKSRGAYVSRVVTMEEPFSNLRVLANISAPSGTSVNMFYQTPDVSDEWKPLSDPLISQIDTDYSRYEWTTAVSPAKSYRIKVEMETSNSLVRPRVQKLMSILKY